MNVPVLTISNRIPTEPYYFYPQFLESCKRQGFDPIFLGGKPEPGKRNPLYRGLMSKPKLLRHWLQENGSQYEHVIVCDAWDIIWLTTPDEVLYNFKGMGARIIFNAEKNCFPVKHLEQRFDDVLGVPHPEGLFYRYLNSGFFVGETAAVLQMLSEMGLETIPDDTKNADGTWTCYNDQEFYSRWFLGDYVWPTSRLAALDYRGILCQSLHGAEDRELAFIPERKRIVSLLTRNEPCLVHGNGSGKEWLKRIIGWLGL